ncbi:hypothetical protein CEUSTIGMA_g4705.t1 [Chlamydomonas eustigma]|uniref:Uncharacterized protein n=1 Tax=Chlamydomonas eustigma TaxID=1157962 RepID=A0A250X2U6_9CHLO|nr:hypothetical protein CEUSTIGMA_g4705.t1 [Chlamydomonas eustigma]|eukprot:GAX77259.1 hypothetical protein CEUSTIGMA_g4705.t1 [Chlamydomonas eustigma]
MRALPIKMVTSYRDPHVISYAALKTLTTYCCGQRTQEWILSSIPPGGVPSCLLCNCRVWRAPDCLTQLHVVVFDEEEKALKCKEGPHCSIYRGVNLTGSSC